MNTLLIIVAVVFTKQAYCNRSNRNTNCVDTYVQGKIKFCNSATGTEPIACLPADDGSVELAPGQTWSGKSFQFECKKTGDRSLSLEIIACILPNKDILAVGAQAGIANKGSYTCTRKADGNVTRRYESGCWIDNKLYIAGQTWEQGQSQVQCIQASGFFEAKASGCVTGTGKIVQLGSAIKQSARRNAGGFFRCQANAQIAWQADLVAISESEYLQLAQVTGEAEEEIATGDSGSGFAQEVAPPAPPPQPAVLPPPPPQPQADVCKDLLPKSTCQALCEPTCASRSDRHEEAIGFALPGQKRKLGKNLFGLPGSHSKQKGSQKYTVSGSGFGGSYGSSSFFASSNGGSFNSRPNAFEAVMRPPQPQRLPRPPSASGTGCNSAVSLLKNFVAAVCPQSCNVCGIAQDLKSLVSGYNGAVCGRSSAPKFDEAIGLSVVKRTQG